MAGHPVPDLMQGEGEEELKNAILSAKPPTAIRVSRAHADSNNAQENGDRQLSYVNLARCLTGYTDLTRYNSRLREGLRSREASPARFILDTSTHSTKDMSCLPPSMNPMKPTTERIETCASSTETVTSSFIEQRIARLYGSSAVQRKVPSPQPKNSEEVAASTENSNDNLPVMKLLRPEFLAQFQFRSSKSPMTKCSSRTSRARLEENGQQSRIPNGNSLDSSIVSVAVSNGDSNKNIEPTKITNGDSVDGTAVKTKNIPVKLFSNLAEEKNGHYYLKILHQEMNHLLKLSDEYQPELAHVTDDVADVIRSAVGKAQLLCNQKLKQFESLCYKNINQKPDEPYPATCEDLGGFWDLVAIQIESIKGMFSELEKIKLAGWTIQDEKVPKILNGVSSKKTEMNNNARVSRPKTSAANKPTEKVKKQREDLRKKIAEERKKMALQKETSDSDILLL
ncbi:uncharacterized protein vlc isoform X2 [Bemisia tabaci]|uniref:uncharacterized protein vlc isoform X2 n=1 Tax=Bemisia tabaci TaxID=7038 RepID=UPI003B280CE5